MKNIKVVNKNTGEEHDLLSMNINLMLEPEMNFLFSKGKKKSPVIHSSKDYCLKDNITIVINKDGIQIKEE